MANNTFNLSDHIGAILALLGIIASIAGVLFWHIITRMEKKLDTWLEVHADCQSKNMKKDDFKYWLQTEWAEWKKGREDIWKRVNSHGHDVHGKVTISEKE